MVKTCATYSHKEADTGMLQELIEGWSISSKGQAELNQRCYEEDEEMGVQIDQLK